MVTIDEHDYHVEQPPAGYIVSCKLEDGQVIIYGTFDTTDDAVKFGGNLINAIVHPLYPPVLH